MRVMRVELRTLLKWMLTQDTFTVASIADSSSTYTNALAPGAVTLNNIVSNGIGTDDVASTATVVTRNNNSHSSSC